MKSRTGNAHAGRAVVDSGQCEDEDSDESIYTA